ncbi:MAG: cellulase family glycosylhydrolase [Chthoniobacterales bacterium]
MSRWTKLAAAAVAAFVGIGATQSIAQLEYLGVNLSGAEFGENNLPGTIPDDYSYPGSSDIIDFVSKGFNTFRLPFRWERIQHSTGTSLNSAELMRLDNFVNFATSVGANVILDVHNFGDFYGETIGKTGSSVTNSDFSDLWTRLANQYKSNDKVIFGLMNEPKGINLGGVGTEDWLGTANSAITAIRDTGAENLILVPGNGFTGAWSWTNPPASFYGTPNAQVMGGVVDSKNNFAYEVHQYLDADSSGTSDSVVSETIGAERLVDFTNWLRANDARGFLGEFGVAPGEMQLNALDNLLDYVDANQDVWQGWTYWSAGEWDANYSFSVADNAASGRPQLAVLEAHLNPVPEPTTWALLGLAGITAMLAVRRNSSR